MVCRIVKVRSCFFLSVKFFVSFAVFFLFGFSILKADNQTEIKQYLLKSIDSTCYSSFQCNELKIQVQDESIPFVFYNFAQNDVEYYAKYIRQWGRSEADAIFIKRPEGTFFWREKDGNVIADTVIETKLPVNAFAGLIALKVNLLTLPSDLQVDYTKINSTYNRRACCKVTVKYPADDASIALLNRISITDFQKLSEERKNFLREKTYLAYELLIGYGKSFVYNYRCYNMYGNNVFSVDFGFPEYLALNASFFKVPDVSVKTATSKDDFSKVAEKSYSQPGFIATTAAQLLQSLYAFFDSLWSFLLRYGSYITLGIAILAIISVVLLKIKERHA